MRGGNIAELEMEGGPERERTVTQITSFQLFFEAVYPKPTISPMLPHYLSSLASLDKTNNQSLSWRKHACSPPALLGTMEPQIPCDSVSEIPDVHSRQGSWGAAPLSPPSLVVSSWTCAQPDFLPSSCIPSEAEALFTYHDTHFQARHQWSLCRPLTRPPSFNIMYYPLWGALILLLLIHSFPTLKVPKLTHSEDEVIY